MRRNSILALVVIVGLSVAAHAQTGLGELAGYVYTEEGALVTGAEITAASPVLLGTRKVITNDRGYYRIINLPPGNYTLMVTKKDYKQQEITNLAVRAGKTSSFNITIEIGEFEEMIVIRHTAPLIDTANAKASINVDGDFLQRLPLSPNQDWKNVWTLIPGADSSMDFRFSDSDSAKNVSLNGQRWSQNTYTVDGMSVMSSLEGEPVVNVSLEEIADIQIVTNGFDASRPSGLGGYINVVTKSGGNELHGSTVLRYQPQEWNWTNVDDGTPADLDYLRANANLGGKIITDKLWVFGSATYDKRNEGISRGAGDRDLWAAVDLSMPEYDSTLRTSTLFGKATYLLSDNAKLIYNYIYNNNHGKNGSRFYAEDAVEEADRFSHNHQITLEYNHSSNISTATKINYRSGGSEHADEPKPERTHFSQTTTYNPNDAYPDGYYGPTWSNGSYVYTNGYQPRKTTDNQLQFKHDSVIYLENLKGDHEIKLGLDYVPYSPFTLHNKYDGFDREQLVKNPTDNKWYTYFRSEIHADEWQYDDRQAKKISGYLQDNWIISDKLTLNLGIRFDKQWDEMKDLDALSFSPGIGINYSVTSDHKNVVQFSVNRQYFALNGGQFWSRGENDYRSTAPARTFYYDKDLDGTFEEVTFVDPRDPTKNQAGEYDWSGLVWGSSYTQTIDPDLHHPYADTVRIGYNRVLPKNMLLSTSFVYIINKDQLVRVDSNQIYDADGTWQGLNNPEFTSVYELTNDRWSSQHQKTFTTMLTKNFSDGWQMMGSYTWTDGTKKGEWRPDEPEYYFFPQSWYEVSHVGNYDNIYNGSGILSQRSQHGRPIAPHTIRVATSVLFPMEISMNANVVWASGKYLEPSVYEFHDSGQSPYKFIFDPSFKLISNPVGALHYRWLTEPRSADRGQGDSIFNMNIGLNKEFTIKRYKVQIFGEIFNVFNSGTDINSHGDQNVFEDDGSLAYEQNRYPLYQSPRVIQTGLRINF